MFHNKVVMIYRKRNWGGIVLNFCYTYRNALTLFVHQVNALRKEHKSLAVYRHKSKSIYLYCAMTQPTGDNWNDHAVFKANL